MLTTVDELSGRLGEQNLVILHAGSRKDYDAGHIPGARLVTLADLSVTGEGGLRLQLPPVDQLKAALEKLGIGEASQVVIYPAGESVQTATRVWFTFDYLGMGAKASLLDGGLIAWRSAGKPVSTELPKWEAGKLGEVKPHPELVVDAAWIAARLKDPGVQLIDARLPEYWSGADTGQMPRGGRIPGSKNVPYISLVDGERKLIPEAQLKPKVTAAGKTVVSYCHIGMQATLIYFAAKMLGQDVKLYDGSFQEWSAKSELLVETGQ